MDIFLDADGLEIEVSISSQHSGSKEWASLVDFWSKVATGTTPTSIKLSVSAFYQRRSWFQIYWLDLGLPLRTSEAFVEAVRSVEKSNKLFDELSQQTYVDPSGYAMELANLKIKRALTPHQLRNVASLLRSPNGANFSVPGAGKTATQYVAWSLLRQRGEAGKLLVVCPKSSFEAWLNEPGAVFAEAPLSEIFEGQIVAPNVEVLIVNYEKLENLRNLGLLIAWLRDNPSTCLVLDEAHRIKGGAAGVRWRACKKLASVATRVDLLTGTPMPQSFDDLRNLLSISWQAIPISHLDDSRLSQIRPGGIFTRTTKDELSLPPIEVHRATVPQGRIQKEIYSSLSRDFATSLQISNIDRVSLLKKGRAVMCVLMAATNPALLNKSTNEELLRSIGWPPKSLDNSKTLASIESYLSLEIPPKFEWVAKYLELASKEGRKVLVWSSFVGNLEALGRYLSKFSPVVIHGGTPFDERQARLDKFRYSPDCSVLLTNPQTLGEGISLHHTTHEAIFVDRTFNAAQYLQAIDRIHRLGLPSDQRTDIYILESDGTIDGRVSARLGEKIERLSTLLNDAGLVEVSLGDELEDDWATNAGFDETDLDEVFAHLAGVK